MTAPCPSSKNIWLRLIVCTGLIACGPQSDPGDAPFGALPAFFDCVGRHGALISAHRGGPSPGYPENALSTLSRSADMGITLLEVDVRETADDHLVLLHDMTLERTTTGRGALQSYTYSDLANVRLKDRSGLPTEDHIPSLAEALHLAKGRAILQLDLKHGTDPQAVIAEIRAADAQNAVVLIAYTTHFAQRLHRLAPDLMISVSVETEKDLFDLLSNSMDTTRLLAFTGTDHPNPTLNGRLKEAEIEAIFGTLGGEQSWDARVARSGNGWHYQDILDEGITIIATDRPLEAASALTDDEAALDVCSVQAPTRK